MRILLDYRPALRARTGVGEFVHELARALGRSAPAGEEIRLLTTSWKDRPSPTIAVELPHAEVIDRRLPVRPLTWAWHHLGWPPVEWLGASADVVHAQSPLLIPARHAAQVVTIHDLDFLTHPERATAEMRRDYPRLVRDHAARADHVVVSSQYAAREVTTHLGVVAERLTVCPPGVPAWTEAVAIRRAERATRGDRGSAILFLGTLEPRKNIRGLLAAYGRLRGLIGDAPPLVLAGNARATVADDLRAVTEPPLAGHVTLRGYVSDEERQRLYLEARLLVLPSHEEGFGLPVLEAMACGVPVVVSDRGALPEVAGAAAVPVDPGDLEGLTAAMARLLDDGEADAAAARGRVEAARYGWDRTAAAARQAYRAAVAARARRAA